MTSIKQTLANGFAATRLDRLLLRAQAALWHPHIRAVNYHDVPASRAAGFEAQLRFYAERFAPVGLEDLRGLRDGAWPHERPGILISFDDGMRSHADVAAPLLEKHGLCGWFMVPTGFVDTPVSEQQTWAGEHDIHVTPSDGDPRVALTWDDVRRLDERHVVVCHSQTHCRLTAELTPGELEREIPAPKAILERQLGHPVAAFAWVGGEEHTYSATAARAIADAGFEFGFMTNNALIRPDTPPLQLQRSNVEASFPLPLVALTLSGVYDLLYWPKRRRVVRTTRTESIARISS